VRIDAGERHFVMAAAQSDSIALKDLQLRYRVCTGGYARAMRLNSASSIVDRDDFDLLPREAARLVRDSDKLVRDSLEPAFIDGGLLSSRLGGKTICTLPLLSRNGVLAGLEVQIVDMALLPAAQQNMFASLLQMRELSTRSPWGVLVHRDYQTLFTNASWLRLHQLSETPSREQLKTWLAAAAASQSSEYDAGRTLYVHRIAVRWNGMPAEAVYVSARADATDAPVTTDKRAYVEKRRGHRRQGETGQPVGGAVVQEQPLVFDALPNPMMICDGWTLLYNNPAAATLFAGQLTVGGDISQLFTDRDQAQIEAGMRDRKHFSEPVHLISRIAGELHQVSVSMLEWHGQLRTLFGLHRLRAGALAPDETRNDLVRLHDFAQAAADFLIEVDADFRVTRYDALAHSAAAFDASILVGRTLAELAQSLAVPDSQGVWDAVLADMNRHQMLRDRELKWQTADGRVAVLRISAVPVFDEDGQFVGYRGGGRDITRYYEDTIAVAYHASHDALTGLVNRREFEKRCDDAVASARNANSTHALCFIDLDNFKTVNDTSGHLAGDELLRQLSAMFTGLVRKSDVLARLGGDEFGVLVFNVGLNEALRLANQIRAEVENFQFLWEDNRFSVGASIGLVIVDERWESRSAVFGAADSACYDAKNQGRNRVAVFQADENEREARSGERPWVELINSALDDERIRLMMQRIKPLNEEDQASRYTELLMRIMTPENELVSPRSFLPAAERYGLASRIDLAVVDVALSWLASQPHLIESLKMCGINLIGQSFADEEFTRLLMKKLSDARVDVSRICFEVTETATIANLTVASRFMKQVGELGCQFSLDDFGSGLSSFAYLKNLPVSYLKIDGLFVRDILEDPIDFAMVKAINDIGQTLGKKTIAEYVENEAVLDKLRDMGVDFAQGYHIGKPVLIDPK
jgi:diguanylate cyclase (GGDEF)-like protein